MLRYQHGQKYDPHWDYFIDNVNGRPENGGQRILTVLMYLSDVEEGGETVFPSADQKVQGPGWSDCARQGLAVKPVCCARGGFIISVCGCAACVADARMGRAT